MLSEISNNLPKLIQNYGSSQSILEEKLAYALECDGKGLIALNGAAQVYPILKRLFAEKRVLIPSPTFGEYSRSFPGAALYADHDGVDMGEFSEKVKNADIVVVVNPNNPSGSLIPSKTILEIAGEHENKIFVIDESFIEFSDDEPVLDLLKKDPLKNVLIIKSLSKSYGCPGLRLGCVYSLNKELISKIRDEVAVWNLNSIGEFFLELILKNKKILKESFAKTKEDRAAFRQLLTKIPGIKSVADSKGNFLLVRLNHKVLNAVELQDYLLRSHSIYVKDLSSRFNGGDGYLRLAVRLPAENEHLVASILSFRPS